MKLSRLIATIAVAASLSLGLAACAPASEPITISTNTIVIDVRTPAEYADGHLDGAINLDVQAPTFDALAAQLPVDSDYVVYCRTGNRSATAIQRLEGLGYTGLINAGGLDEAAASTGLDIVR